MPNRILAILLDCGDTLVDEATQITDGTAVALCGELIPGARELLEQLKQRGYPLALVADGPAATFRNLLTQHHVTRFFDAFAISEHVGHAKPHPDMFHHALAQLNIPPRDYARVVMVGNNLERDIKGANALDIISVWLDWSPRRSKVPADESEMPQHTIKMPLDLVPLLDALEKQ